MRRWVVLASCLIVSAAGLAALSPATSPRDIAASVREYRRAHEPAIVGELTTLLAMPNIAGDAADMGRNAALLKTMLERRGVAVQFLDVEHRGPIIVGSLPAPGATRTLVFYAHYDGQPVDAAAWTGTKPFEPALRTASIAEGGVLRPFPAAGTPYEDDWRIYARSSSDDKSPIVAMLAAIDALADRRIARKVSLKIILDSEEEAGSPGLARLVPGHAALVAGDVLITGDGPVHATGRPLVFFGNRGIMEFQLTVYGPVRGSAQWPLRELGAESGDAARATARVDERRRRPCARRRILRRRGAAERAGAGRRRRDAQRGRRSRP